MVGHEITNEFVFVERYRELTLKWAKTHDLFLTGFSVRQPKEEEYQPSDTDHEQNIDRPIRHDVE